MAEQKQISEMTFEEALKELQAIVKEIETGQESLDKIIHYYERGNQLKKHCESMLQSAKLKVEKIMNDENGEQSLKEGLD